ncbi:RHS repeat-associated core domain-containing protein, partial [Rhodocaloribacter sp.]
GNAPKERFTGHELDEETTLLYAGARYFDPALGRWLSVDPMADNYPGWSSYNYALNNPVGLSDPTGNCPEGVRHGEVWTTDQGEDVACYLPDDQEIVVEEDETYVGQRLPREVAAEYESETYVIVVEFHTTSSDQTNADQAVRPEMAQAFAGAVAEAGSVTKIESVGVLATTNGRHLATGRHYTGRGVDVTWVNGQDVRTIGTNNPVKALQIAFDNQTGRYENYGPYMMRKSGAAYIHDGLSEKKHAARIKVKIEHQGHIHWSTD